MKDDKQQRIFSTNLIRLIRDSGKTQKEIADEMGVSPQTLNTWCKGIAIPRMGRVQMIADFFKVGKTELLDERRYFDSELKYCLDILQRNQQYVALLTEASKLNAEALDNLIRFMESLQLERRDINETSKR